MITSQDFRNQVAGQLASAASQVPALTAFVGLDGFVDEILHVVDKRYDANRYDRVPTIAAYAQRLAAAAGKSTNVELVNVMTKLGGNGPIMANALARFGIGVTYVGSLGWPAMHPVFEPFAARADVTTICEPGLTDALEFEDGKLMVGKHYTLKQVSWENITARYGREKFATKFNTSNLVAFVNWTMLPYMSDIWASIQSELLPDVAGARRRMFFDLADPEKRTPADIARALELIGKFQSKFDVILGLNEKEAYEIAKVLGLNSAPQEWEGLAALSVEIQKRTAVETLVVHPVAYALAVSDGKADVVIGPVCKQPKITTGAGDHFNSGFCLGKLLGLDNAASVLCGVSTSGHYVRTAESPTVSDLTALMTNWPQG
jgi:sugar/nucleoside kinase (ribokinase family)